MNNNQDKNLCYVFSLSTAETAIQEWLTEKIESEPKREEEFKIFAVALPWFLEHIQQDASIYMFTDDDLLEEIEMWKQAQLISFPKQKIRIDETCSLIILFFHSHIVKEHKMMIEA